MIKSPNFERWFFLQKNRAWFWGENESLELIFFYFSAHIDQSRYYIPSKCWSLSKITPTPTIVICKIYFNFLGATPRTTTRRTTTTPIPTTTTRRTTTPRTTTRKPTTTTSHQPSPTSSSYPRPRPQPPTTTTRRPYRPNTRRPHGGLLPPPPAVVPAKNRPERVSKCLVFNVTSDVAGITCQPGRTADHLEYYHVQVIQSKDIVK